MTSQPENQLPEDEAPEPWEGGAGEVSGELSARKGWLTVPELSACLGTSPRTIREVYARIDQRLIAKRGNRLWIRAAECIVEYFRTRTRKVEGGDEPTGNAAQQRWTTIRADLAELELSKRRGELIEAESVRAAWSIVVGEIRGLGDRLQRKYGEDAQRAVVEAVDRIEAAVKATGGADANGSESGA